MAGAGFKTFNTGDVLTASDVNTYLMQQTVMVFADASARSTALGANVAEGMLSYLKDTNATEAYNGSSWVNVGNSGDIEGVTAGAGLSGGGTSGTVTLSLNTTAAGRNAVINGGFDIWQRGTTITPATKTYNADRWITGRGGWAAGSKVSRELTNDTTNLSFVQYCARIQRDSGNTSTANIFTNQSFESTNSIPLAGRTVVFSFYARAGANFSSASSALSYSVYTGTGTDQNVNDGFTGSATPIATTATLTTTWQRFQATATLSSSAKQIAVEFAFTPVGTAGANDYFEVTGVQLEVGSVATQFSRATGSIQGELAAAMRYFYAVPAGNGKVISNAFAYAASEVDTVINFPVQMRTTPTLAGTGGTNFFGFFRNGGEDDFDGFTLAGESTAGGAWIYNNAQISGTAGQAGLVRFKNASASLTFSAEL